MNCSILKLIDFFHKHKHLINGEAYCSFEDSFDIEFAHNSTAIEGNSLTLIETKSLLDDNISVGGKSMRELYEVINHNKAFKYIKEQIIKGFPLSELIIKEIHSILVENIFIGGVYRDGGVRIRGASHKPPEQSEMYYQIKKFYEDLPFKERELSPIELAAYSHAEFVKIHPFPDGNGRTSRLIMNYQLMSKGLLPVSIACKDRANYYELLDNYVTTNDLDSFSQFIASLEHARLKDVISMIPSYEQLLNSQKNNCSR